MKHPDHLFVACGVILGTLLLLWIFVRAIRWAKRGSRGTTILAAAAFPFPELPPPHEQVDNAIRQRKAGESGDPK
jgi:hypothetical protein